MEFESGSLSWQLQYVYKKNIPRKNYIYERMLRETSNVVIVTRSDYKM